MAYFVFLTANLKYYVQLAIHIIMYYERRISNEIDFVLVRDSNSFTLCKSSSRFNNANYLNFVRVDRNCLSLYLNHDHNHVISLFTNKICSDVGNQ